MPSGKQTTTQTPSPLDAARAKFAQQLGPYLMPQLISGLTGQPTAEQGLATLNVQNQLKSQLGRMGVSPGDPRMFELFRKTTEGMTKPSADIFNTAMQLYTGTPGVGGGTSTTTQPGAIETVGGLANMGMSTAMMLSLLGVISSQELKQDIEPMESGECLKKVCSLRSVGYKWKHSAEKDAGLIAEELTEVIPEAGAMVGGYNGIKPLTVIGYLVESIKQLNNEITELKAQIGGDG